MEDRDHVRPRRGGLALPPPQAVSNVLSRQRRKQRVRVVLSKFVEDATVRVERAFSRVAFKLPPVQKRVYRSFDPHANECSTIVRRSSRASDWPPDSISICIDVIERDVDPSRKILGFFL